MIGSIDPINSTLSIASFATTVMGRRVIGSGKLISVGDSASRIRVELGVALVPPDATTRHIER